MGNGGLLYTSQVAELFGINELLLKEIMSSALSIVAVNCEKRLYEFKLSAVTAEDMISFSNSSLIPKSLSLIHI